MDETEAEKDKVWHQCQCGARYSQPQSLKRHQENNGCYKKRKSSEPQPSLNIEKDVIWLKEDISEEYGDLISELTSCAYVK